MSFIVGITKTTILALIFPNFHEKLILGIPWLVEENPIIDWAIGRVTIEENGSAYTLPSYHQCLNNPEDEERLTAKEINFISAKAVQKRTQRGSSDDRGFFGIDSEGG